MDVYSQDLTAFKAWMEKLQSKSYYKSLTQAHLESAEGAELETDGDDFELLAHLVQDHLLYATAAAPSLS
jgi:hypothetical protein